MNLCSYGSPEQHRSRSITTLEAMLHAQMTNSLKGNPKAALTVLALAKKAGMLSSIDPSAGLGGVVRVPHEGDEAKILRMFRAEQAARQKPK
jgi:hypothetical protein